MAFIYSYESGNNELMLKRYETPIKMLIESESDNQRKKQSMLTQLFNVERSDRYGELVNIRSDFSTFAPAYEGEAAETDGSAHAFTKVIEHIPFMKEFIITKQMIDDSATGLAVDAKRRAQAFVRAYYLTMNKLAETVLMDGGWQPYQSLLAIGSGGFFGVGLGNSFQKQLWLPEPQNDFIFAIVCEELGFVGALLTLFIFFITVKRIITLSLRSEGIFERLVTFGVGAKIATQTLLNVAVVSNTIPNTGISLPFFSYGGSSLIMLFFEIGMVLSFSRTARITK